MVSSQSQLEMAMACMEVEGYCTAEDVLIARRSSVVVVVPFASADRWTPPVVCMRYCKGTTIRIDRGLYLPWYRAVVAAVILRASAIEQGVSSNVRLCLCCR